MIYTSYFANLRKLPSHIVPISICGRAPNWYAGLQYKKLAPKWDFFKVWKETHDTEYYIKCFQAQVIDTLDIREVCADLKNLAKFGHIALVCYERPSEFCHRHLVADWMKSHGIPIKEWEEGDT